MPFGGARQLTLEPNSPVTIAREVRFNIELRSPNSETLETAQKRVREIISAAEEVICTEEAAFQRAVEAGAYLDD